MSGSKEFTFNTIGATTALTGMALRAYQERRQRIHNAKIQTELATQAKITQINKDHQKRTVVVLPSQRERISNPITDSSLEKVKALQSKIPQIKREYQELVENQLLDSQTVETALQRVETALSVNELILAETHLQLLDDARILAVQSQRNQIKAHIEYLETRIKNLEPLIPKQIALDLEKQITSYRNNWMQHGTHLEEIHTYINELEAQVEQIQIAADNLVDSWLEVGYDAQITGIDDGDIVIQIATHDCANTEMRIQFTGEKIDLLAPSEEHSLCTDRTFAALRIFQQQGYQLQWTRWDGNVIPPEWQNLYSNYDGRAPVQQKPQAKKTQRQPQEY